MSPTDARGAAGKCHANTACARRVCFRVLLETSQPRQVRRQADACADHVGEVIQELRAWAAERDIGPGQLTILAIEPVAAKLASFAFSTIPLTV